MAQPALIRRMKAILDSSWVQARPQTDSELNQLVSQANALRSAGVVMETTQVTNLATLNTHIADTGKHSRWGVRHGIRIRPGASGIASTIDFDIDGAISSSDGSTVITAAMAPSTITVDLTSFSAVNGVDHATPLVEGWYSLWILWNPGTEVAAGIVSRSMTSPIPFAGYTKKAKLCYIYINDSLDLDPFSWDEASGLFRLYTAHTAPDTPFRWSVVTGVGTWATITLRAEMVPHTDISHILITAYCNTGLLHQRPAGSSSAATLATTLIDETTTGLEYDFERIMPVNESREIDLQLSAAVASHIYFIGYFFGG